MHEMKEHGIGFVAGQWSLDETRPTVIFIHGSGGSHILWTAQVRDLADQFNTIAIDLPGHGASDGLSANRIDDYAGQVDSFVQSIGVEQPIVCGLSIGGAIVLQLLLTQADRYKAGIIVNSGARLRVLPVIFDSIEKDYAGYVNSLYSFGASPKTPREKLKPMIDDMNQCPPQVAVDDFTACDGFDVIDQVPQITVPVLILTASDDQLTPVKYGTFLNEKIKTSTLHQIDDAGHLSPMEQPEAVSMAIREFVGSLMR